MNDFEKRKSKAIELRGSMMDVVKKIEQEDHVPVVTISFDDGEDSLIMTKSNINNSNADTMD